MSLPEYHMQSPKPGFVVLCFALTLAAFLVANPTALGKSQPVFVEPANSWGGQLVHEPVPYQPSALFVQPGKNLDPVLLDQLAPPPGTFLPAGLAANSVPAAEDLTNASSPPLPPGARNGIFQKLFFTGTWLPQLENDSLGWSSLETGVVFGFPFFRRDTPLLITPRFGVHFLDRPATPDLPDKVYDASLEFRHLRKLGQGPWAMDVAVTLGYYSDFEISDSQAFRVTGRGLGVYESSPTTKWVFGVAYLNGAGASVLPVGGVLYQPSPDVKWDLVFPQPRIAWRLPGEIPNNRDERWFYVGGEFGSGLWSIQRPLTQTLDLLTYFDYRVILGLERKITGGLSRRYEVAYVFGRELEFDSATPNISLDDTLMLRAGFTY